MKINGIDYGESITLEVKEDEDLPKTDVEISNEDTETFFRIKRSVFNNMSNVISGTFNGAEPGAMEVHIPYSGTGYPVGLVVAHKTGIDQVVDDAPCKNPTVTFYAWKRSPFSFPSYASEDDEDLYMYFNLYRFPGAGSYTVPAGGHSLALTSGNDAGGTGSKDIIFFKDNKTLSVYIADASQTEGTVYGFFQGEDYLYYVIYSDGMAEANNVR